MLFFRKFLCCSLFLRSLFFRLWFFWRLLSLCLSLLWLLWTFAALLIFLTTLTWMRTSFDFFSLLFYLDLFSTFFWLINLSLFSLRFRLLLLWAVIFFCLRFITLTFCLFLRWLCLDLTWGLTFELVNFSIWLRRVSLDASLAWFLVWRLPL